MIEFLGIVNTALPLVSIIGTVLAACGMWYLSRSFVTRAEHEAVQARLGDMECKTGDLEKFVAAVSSRLDALPGAEAVTQLRVDVASLRGEVGGLREGMKRVEHMLSLLTEHHINREP